MIGLEKWILEFEYWLLKFNHRAPRSAEILTGEFEAFDVIPFIQVRVNLIFQDSISFTVHNLNLIHSSE